MLLLLLLVLSGCSGGENAAPVSGIESGETIPPRSQPATPAAPAAEKPAAPYQAPAFASSAFHAEGAEGNDAVRLDLSALREGYVAVSATSDHRLKFQVKKDDSTYNYDLASDGTPSIFPLQSGNGSYLFRVMENVSESKYAELYSSTAEVSLADEFAPFLRPSDYVPYAADSACVIRAKELAGSASTALGVVAEVYSFICSGVTYDYDKAANVKSGYLPDTDETLRTGKGICFDYAALAAAMLRSQGIPTKMIFGYVSPNDLYHAWNMFYTAETGWVTVGYEVKGPSWNRLDLTFSAGGEDADFIGDGSNYSDLYFY